ncbi:hypothetical protein HY612_02385 [Candidatus Roizmanbacteria bacterium]|nr:hypothetical protein [Candidatus Roizmanbacteria bacterium]
MRLKKKSLIFLLILFIILIFIIGVRYGQRVEKTNKIVDYLISLPPTQTPQPTQKPLEFKTYTNKLCAIEFTYPSNFAKLEESSKSARFSDGIQPLTFDCNEDNKIKRIFENPQNATAEAKFKNKSILIKIKPEIRLIVGLKPIWVFKLVNPLNKKNIYFEISQPLYPLLEKSLEFLAF